MLFLRSGQPIVYDFGALASVGRWFHCAETLLCVILQFAAHRGAASSRAVRTVSVHRSRQTTAMLCALPTVRKRLNSLNGRGRTTNMATLLLSTDVLQNYVSYVSVLLSYNYNNNIRPTHRLSRRTLSEHTRHLPPHRPSVDHKCTRLLGP